MNNDWRSMHHMWTEKIYFTKAWENGCGNGNASLINRMGCVTTLNAKVSAGSLSWSFVISLWVDESGRGLENGTYYHAKGKPQLAVTTRGTLSEINDATVNQWITKWIEAREAKDTRSRDVKILQPETRRSDIMHESHFVYGSSVRCMGDDPRWQNNIRLVTLWNACVKFVKWYTTQLASPSYHN